MAEEIMALGDVLLQRAEQETALPQARLTGERARTVNQIKMFADLVREGSWVEAAIDRAQPDRKPLAKPDLRRKLISIGPVVVFGASNIPLAFSVAGGDTASALAAGNPAIVKAHPAHPGTSELVASAIVKALDRSGLPPGLFSLLHGRSHEVSLRLVRHPLVKAVGFTGSLPAGRALFNAAAGRPEPIPVYAEMGSTNPVFILPGALKQKAGAIAEGFVQSVTMGVGQFCTNPGLVFGLADDSLNAFVQ
jgi:NADP-dependent aldehyde dehydrogenase